MDKLNKQKYIFAKLFLMANKMQIIGDRVLAGEMTIRQWLLTAAVAGLGEASPTMGELARYMGSSHQNVRQLALKLREKGFLELEKDEKDFRQTRLRLTGKTQDFWNRSQDEVKSFLSEVFSSFSADEMDSLCNCINKLYKSTKIKQQNI